MSEPEPLTAAELDAWERRLPRTDHTACCERPTSVRRLIAMAHRCLDAERRYRELETRYKRAIEARDWAMAALKRRDDAASEHLDELEDRLWGEGKAQ